VGCRQAPGALRVTFLDVGQGDSTVIETPSGKVVLIDGGGTPGRDPREGGDPGSRIVVPFLRSRGISTIDLLIATHPDDDHVQGLLAVTERLSVRAVLDSGIPSAPGSSLALLRTAWRARGVRVHQAQRGQSFELGNGARLEVLHPTPSLLHGTPSDDNNNAIVTRLVYGKAKVLFMADAQVEAEESLLQAHLDLTADILKVGHHGARTSTTAAFLQRAAPQAAIVSCGRQNRFGHPHSEALTRLKNQQIQLFRTDQQGAIALESNGEQFHIVPSIRL
jgi:competence protein ComEC